MNSKPLQPFEPDPFESFFRDDSWNLGLSHVGRRELGTVHRRELASLLTEAARTSMGLGTSATEYGALLEPVPGAWRERAQRTLAVLDRDGQYFDGQELVEDKLMGEQPTPELMLLAALDLWEAPSAYLALGQALLARGDGHRAKELYGELLRQSEAGGLEGGQDFSWRLREGLGASWESLGSDVLAFGCMRSAVELEGSGAGPLVAAFFLGLELGRTDEVAMFATRLDRRFHKDSRRLEACARGLRMRIERRQARRGDGIWTPPAKSVGLFQELLQGKGAAARLGRALVMPATGELAP